MLRHFPENVISPSTLVESAHFTVKLAENREDVESAQRLRYQVFNLEQGRGLRSAARYGIDFDEFDEYCLHLLVIEKRSGKVVGTYRAHLGLIANSAKGFYSSKEYEIHGLYRIADKCIELGRTCVDPEYRSGAVVAMLWAGITELIKRADLKYMLGCVSLDETDAAIGWALYEYISERYSVSRDFIVIPRPGFRLERPSRPTVDRLLADEKSLVKKIPAIFKGYLRLGGLICGEPAMDREFGSIDFFILVDVDRVPARYKQHFKYGEEAGG